jgi:hypothetical protein
LPDCWSAANALRSIRRKRLHDVPDRVTKPALSDDTVSVLAQDQNWMEIVSELAECCRAIDPNSFFVQGGDAPQFQSLLEAARP